jgi:hypothetical protein
MLKYLLVLLALSACASQNINLDKLKTDDRIYTGKMSVDLNGKTNKDLVCDVFLNVDLNPAFRISADGLYYFKTSRQKLSLNKITCLSKIDGKSQWITHDIDVKKIKRNEDENTVTSLGLMDIHWKIQDQSEQLGTKFATDMDERLNNIGKFKYEVKPNLAEQTTFVQEKLPGLKDPKYKFDEKLFEKVED